MKNIKLSVALLAALSAFYSCTNEDSVSSSSEYVNSVRVNVEDFISEGLTSRTAYTVDNTGFHFSWADGDALGIYPIGGDQVKFPISSGDGSSSANFDGGSWKLRSTYQYAAYYPFSTDNYTIAQTALPVSYTGQTQNGNASTSHLGAYDYLACAATTPDASGGVDLAMKHLGAFLRLQLTMPKADTYSSVELKSDGAKFVTAGTFDLTAATPAITSTATSDTYTINLTNLSTTAKSEVVTVYAMVAPADLSSSNITVTVHGTGQTTYVQTVTGKNFEARYGYNIAVTSFTSGTNASGEDVYWEEETTTTGKDNGHGYVDLGLSVKWAKTNVGCDTETGYGGYFAWGETTCGKTSYTVGNYKYYSYDNTNGVYTGGYTKYADSTTGYNGFYDNKTVLEASDDAATVNWGSNWRIPTPAEWKELADNCTWSHQTINGISGFKVMSSNGNYIFLPDAGYYTLSYQQSYQYGRYWANKVGEGTSSAYLMWTAEYTDGASLASAVQRTSGCSVRPVYTK